jgi:hypothetical protein
MGGVVGREEARMGYVRLLLLDERVDGIVVKVVHGLNDSSNPV